VIKFSANCHGCPRVLEVTAYAMPPSFQVLSTHGWQQFLNGPTLCEECAQNAEQIERVHKIWKETYSKCPPIEAPAQTPIPEEKAESEERLGGSLALPAQPGSNGHAVVDLPSPTRFERHAKRMSVSNEELQAALDRNEGSVIKAGRETGLSSPTIYSRIKTGKVAQYGFRRNNAVPPLAIL
jgi:hypothetical protein